MLIGLMSDTHGYEDRARRAAAILLDQGVEHVFHCGDIGTEAVLVELAEILGANRIPVDAVLGNTDYQYQPLLQFPGRETGVTVHGYTFKTELDGKRIAVYHGHEPRIVPDMVRSGAFDFVFCGHTHVAEDRTEGDVRIINPGAVFRAAVPSVATLDTRTGELNILPLGK